MIKYRTFDEVTEEYFCNHPEEMDCFVSVLFEEYAQDRDTATLLSGLRVVCRVKGVSVIAETSGLSQEEVQGVFSEGGNPTFASVSAIINALGYWLAPQ